MNYIGISSGFHDAALSVLDNSGNILFAAHSERYSKNKHDKDIDYSLLSEAITYSGNDCQFHYYEKPYLKNLRRIRSGEISPTMLFSFPKFKFKYQTHNHHLSHAAAGFQTSPFDSATVVVIDAIGEFDSATIWNAEYKDGIAVYKKVWSLKYPNSLGLFYSAMTERVGLKPLDEEYILMGMSAYGNNRYRDIIIESLIDDLNFKENLHLGIDPNFLKDADIYDIAASAQSVIETLMVRILEIAKKLNFSSNLVYGGGVALNCLANRLLGQYFDNIWIMPNPGDAGSSLGAAALGYKRRINWKNAFLGYNIEGSYPVKQIIEELSINKIVGVANGRAEFGPRALGNRSLLADPRGDTIKDKVNEIKRRQKFRPFAPVILEEHVHKYFDMPFNWNNSRYMQVVAKCKYPNLFPAIVHYDGTSRVQTVSNDGTGIRKLLEQWYQLTGCPMLLNTSLNVRGEPMVNDRADADRFEKLYNVKVY